MWNYHEVNNSLNTVDITAAELLIFVCACAVTLYLDLFTCWISKLHAHKVYVTAKWNGHLTLVWRAIDSGHLLTKQNT